MSPHLVVQDGTEQPAGGGAVEHHLVGAPLDLAHRSSEVAVAEGGQDGGRVAPVPAQMEGGIVEGVQLDVVEPTLRRTGGIRRHPALRHRTNGTAAKN